MEKRERERERDDVAIIIESGADVASFPLNMADHGAGELEFNAATKTTRCPRESYPHRGYEECPSLDLLADIDGHEVLLKDNVIFSSKVNHPILCYGRLMEHGWGSNGQSRPWRIAT